MIMFMMMIIIILMTLMDDDDHSLTQDLTLLCRAEGSPPPQTVWIKDDVILRDGESSSLRIEEDSLYIRKSHLSDLYRILWISIFC